LKIFTHNFDPSSNSGPNKFTRQLFTKLIEKFNIELVDQEEADMEFCLIQEQIKKKKPSVLRLDGIYFNSEQDFTAQNKPIKQAYLNSDAVIFQSEFNKELTENWFGKHNNSFVIHNSVDKKLIEEAEPSIFDKIFTPEDVVWSCASDWRPHKRLHSNIEYFLNNAPTNAKLAIAGKNITKADVLRYESLLNTRLYFFGEIKYHGLLSLYKRSQKFIHLAYMDHCPNVVVDAQAAGCEIVCSSSGGTKEIVTKGIVVKDGYWSTVKPLALYKPPALDFSNCKKIDREPMPCLESTSEKYYQVLRSVL
jgi:glycosyltransferase involved in cell wall biosynthesis